MAAVGQSSDVISGALCRLFHQFRRADCQLQCRHSFEMTGQGRSLDWRLLRTLDTKDPFVVPDHIESHLPGR
ncbi:hypothetical protein NKJ90_13350 [Mesorhizobium sp. M0051]|uniref:hypothetical protein n=1 Tax=unclassified Mesorhizobium TaxID=325217 RepID=UPI001FD8FE2E|nr:hypothetical protein [Mesorhizobium sp. LNHC252B00]